MFGGGIDGVLKPLECMACTKALDWVDNTVLGNKKIVDYIFDAFAAACFISGKFKPRRQCREFVTQFGRPLVEVTSKHLLTRDRICTELLGFCNHPHITEINLEQAVNDILATKPSEIQDDNFINDLYAQIAEDTSERPTLSVLQLSDVHLDFSYQPGTKEDCGDAACCRTEVGYPPAGEPGAGEWGSLHCDLPMKTFGTLLDYITNTVKPDLIVWTGDNTAHNVWTNTADETTIYTITVTNMIKMALKDSNITLLPI